MSLRIKRLPEDNPSLIGVRNSHADGDSWSARLVKLMPAEALACYGAGHTLVPENKPEALLGLAVFCLLLTGWLRYHATRTEGAAPQLGAIAIAMVSFALWLLTLPVPAGPFDLGDNRYLGALLALGWTTLVTSVYRGD